MNACDFRVFDKFDLGACLHSLAFGWVPDWVWMLLPYWPWIIIAGGAFMAFRFAGWPGVAMFFGGVGFVAGRRSVEQQEPVPNEEVWPDPDHPEKPKKRTRTIKDMFGLGKR